MKTGIIIGILAGIITVILVVFIILSNLILPLNRQFSSAGEPDNPRLTPPVSKSTGNTPDQTALLSDNLISPAITSPSTSQSPSPPSSVAVKDVNFLLDITSAEITGLNTATVKANVTNSGTTVAHHTVATIEIICQNERILINGQESLQVNIGDLAPGESKQIQLKVEVGLSDALRIKQTGATVRLTIVSDEKRQVFTYDYIP